MSKLAASILSALAFATIVVIYVFASTHAEVISAEAIFHEYVYHAEVEAEDNCTVYLPVPFKNEVAGFCSGENCFRVEEGEGEVVDTPHGRMLKVNGSAKFEAYMLAEKPLNIVSLDIYMLHPRLNNTTLIYSTCKAFVSVELLGYNDWIEKRRALFWAKDVRWWECYRDAVKAEVGEGWNAVKAHLEAKRCYDLECKRRWCP